MLGALAWHTVTARARNVNLAFAISPGWEPRFGNHALYLAGLWLLAGGLFFAIERIWLRDARRVLAARS